MTKPTDPPATGQTARRFIPLLRLVHPSPPAAPRRKGQRPPPLFTAAEEQLLRASLKTARGLFGSWACLAAAMHVSDRVDLIANGRAPVSATIAIRLSKALGVPLDALTRPGLRPVKAPCPTCGGAA